MVNNSLDKNTLFLVLQWPNILKSFTYLVWITSDAVNWKDTNQLEMAKVVTGQFLTRHNQEFISEIEHIVLANF